MDTQTIKHLSDLLDLADKQALNAAHALNMLDSRMNVSSDVQKEIDVEASNVKGAVNYILQVQQQLKELKNNISSDKLVELWLVKGEYDAEDWMSLIFSWPFPSLPVAGDKVETMNVIKALCPNIPAEFLHVDYYKVLYSFYETDGKGNHYVSIKLTDQWLS